MIQAPADRHHDGSDPFERIAVGQCAELTHRLERADVDAFAGLTGDDNPLHLDPEFAARTQFRRPVVHGMLSASFLSTLIGTVLPGEGALWLSQSIAFQAPAFVGDTLQIRGTVRQKSPATRIIVLDLAITNQHGDAVITGEASVMMPRVHTSAPMSSSTNVTLITGGSRGIGAAIARNLAAQGRPVAITYLSREDEATALAAAITAEGGRALALQADVTDQAALTRLVAEVTERLGPVDALVHGAAPPNPISAFLELDPEAMHRQFEVQVGGAQLCCRAVLPAMLAAGTGSIVFIGSIAAEGQPPAQQTDYIVAKAALAALARCLAVEYGPKGIRVNVVAPGMTQTERIDAMPEKAKLLTRMQAPLRRLAEADEVAAVVGFLLGPQARHVTGITLPVCGGVSMG